MEENTCKNEKFDMKVVHDKFESSLHEEDDVDLKFYLDSFEELNKFFDALGSIFGFVSNDLKEKMNILYSFINNEETSEKYKTVKKMIEHEKGNNLLNKSDFVSGSRTLLRIHRGLDFINLFLQKISEVEDHENTAAICRAAYDETLYHHHTFFIRTGAKLAMYTLPTRGQLLKNVCGEDEAEVKRALDILPNALKNSSTVFLRVETLYSVHKLHDLP